MHLFLLKGLFGVICFVLLAFAADAQTLLITDAKTKEPIDGALVICSTGFTSAITDKNGLADISGFRGCDSLVIQLIGYQPQGLKVGATNQAKIQVSLQPGGTALTEVVVSAMGWRQEKREVTHRITAINPREIALQQPQTAADMLAQTGEVFVQKSQMGGGSPMIRGFAANRVLIVVDGIRMNNAIFRSGNLQNVISVDPFALSGAEVVFGPGSVLYGSDAIGGVMNFQTLRPRFSTHDSLHLNGSSTLRYATANNEKTGHTHLNFGLKKWAFVSSITRSDFDDLRMGKHGPDAYLRPEVVVSDAGSDYVVQNPDPLVQKPTAYSQGTLMQKVRFRPNPRWNFTYTALYSTTSNIPRYDRQAEYRDGQLRFAVWSYGPQKWLLNSLSAAHTDSTKLFDALNTTLAWQQFKESRFDRRFQSDNLTIQNEKVNAYLLTVNASKALHPNHQLYYGTEANFNKVRSYGSLHDMATLQYSQAAARYPDKSTYRSLAAYAYYLFRITPKTTLQAGARYTHTLIQAVFDSTFLSLPFKNTNLNTGALNGNAGIAYRPNQNWQLNAQLATGFRAPNIDDVGKVFESAPGALVVPNPNLKAEYAWSAETGLTKLFGHSLKAEITGYYTYLANALVRRNFQLNGYDSVTFAGETSRIQAIQNAAYGYIWGMQTSLHATLPYGFGASAHYNYQRGKEEDETGKISSLRHAAPAFGLLRVTYTHRKLAIELNTQFNGEIPNSRLALSEQEKPQLYAPDENGQPYSPAWQTYNAKLSLGFYQNLFLNLGLENMTNQRYRTYSSGIAAAGRNFIVSLRADF